MLCEACLELRVRTIEEADFEDIACPNCGEANLVKFRKFIGAVPAAFRTKNWNDTTPGADEKGKVVFAALVAVSSHPGDIASRPIRPANTNTLLEHRQAGRVYRINHNQGKFFSGAVRNEALSGQNVAGQWILADGRQAAGQNVETIALLAPKTTDVLRVELQNVPPGMNLDPLRPGSAVRAAYYSAATILVRAAAYQLDVDSEEMAADVADPYARLFLPLASYVAGFERKRVLTIAKAVRLVRGRIEMLRPVPMPALVEQRFGSPDGWLFGQIDRVAHEDGRTVIIDYKSGLLGDTDHAAAPGEEPAIKEEYTQQLMLYAYLFYTREGSWPDLLRVEGIDGSMREMEVAPVDCERLAQAAKARLAEVNKVIASANAGETEISSLAGEIGSSVCRWCA